MAKAAKSAKRAKNTVAPKKVTKLPSNGRTRFPRQNVGKKAGD
jgi:hypothetical protein